VGLSLLHHIIPVIKALMLCLRALGSRHTLCASRGRAGMRLRLRLCRTGHRESGCDASRCVVGLEIEHPTRKEFGPEIAPLESRGLTNEVWLNTSVRTSMEGPPGPTRKRNVFVSREDPKMHWRLGRTGKELSVGPWPEPNVAPTRAYRLVRGLVHRRRIQEPYRGSDWSLIDVDSGSFV